jgi:O-antigen/teichoic acid export membrane protein
MNSNFSEEDIKKVAKGTGISLFGMTMAGGLWLLCQIIIARLFGAEVFGLYILGITTLKITELFARFGLHTGAMRFVSIYREKNPEKVKGVLKTSVSASFLNGILLGAILYFLSGTLSELVFHKPELRDVIKTFAFAVPFMASMMVVATSTQGFHTAKYAVYTRDIIQPSTNILLIFLFNYLGSGLLGVVYSFILSYFIALIVGIFCIGKIFPVIKDKTLNPVYNPKELILYSAPLVFIGVLHFLISWTDTIMLGIMTTSQDVGIFRAATQIPVLLPMFLAASNSIYAPIIAELYHKGEMKRMESMLKTTTRWVYIIVLPVSLILIFSANEVMSIFGSGFVEKGVPIFIIITIAQLIDCITGGIGFVLVMTGRQNIELFNSSVLVLMIILLNLFLIPRYGALGAAITTALSIILINLLRLAEVYKLYKMHPYTKSYMKSFAPTAIALIFMFTIRLLGVQSIWNAVANVLAVGLTFTLFMKIIKLDEEEQYILSLVKQKVAAKIWGRVGV